MNQGDKLKVTVKDTPAGMLNKIEDVTTGKAGYMNLCMPAATVKLIYSRVKAEVESEQQEYWHPSKGSPECSPENTSFATLTSRRIQPRFDTLLYALCSSVIQEIGSQV